MYAMSAKVQSSHQKHTSLSKPDLQQFGRNELSIVGTSCATIQNLADRIASALSDQYKIGYVDAEHSGENHREADETDLAFNRRFVQRYGAQQLTFYRALNSYQLKPLFNEQDLILLNGNHFEAQTQIFVIDPEKPLDPDRLGDVAMLLLSEGVEKVPAGISKELSNGVQLPVFSIDQTDRIASRIERLISETIPPLAGLVLAGGKSTRMHTDKTQLNYHGKPQQLYLYDLLADFCDDVFLSCRKEQAKAMDKKLSIITDSFLDMGPMGALLSAFRNHPNTAWLSVACDLPLLSAQTLRSLTEQRNPAKIATAFLNPESDFPEPLVTIWEPKSYQLLLQFLGMGYSCPRKVLINADVELIEPLQPQELMNANTPGQYKRALKKISIRQ